MLPIKSFTTRYNRLLNRLINEVGIGVAFDPKNSPPNATENQISGSYLALWDTGATNTVITEQVVKEVGLNPIGMTRIEHAGGPQDSPTYLVSVWLPNKVYIPSIKVTQGILKNVGLLIGMDVINLGDFVVNNHGGITSFSFRIPSLEVVDYTKPNKKETNTQNSPVKQPCPCGSGIPFEACHGKKTKRGRRKSSRMNK